MIDNVHDIYNWDTASLYALFIVTLEEENEDGFKLKKLYKEDLMKVREGVNIKFPIWYLTNEWYTLYPPNKRVQIKGYGKIDIDEFMKEKERREQIMRTIILNNNKQVKLTKPRI